MSEYFKFSRVLNLLTIKSKYFCIDESIAAGDTKFSRVLNIVNDQEQTFLQSIVTGNTGYHVYQNAEKSPPNKAGCLINNNVAGFVFRVQLQFSYSDIQHPFYKW